MGGFENLLRRLGYAKLQRYGLLLTADDRILAQRPDILDDGYGGRVVGWRDADLAASELARWTPGGRAPATPSKFVSPPPIPRRPAVTAPMAVVAAPVAPPPVATAPIFAPAPPNVAQPLSNPAQPSPAPAVVAAPTLAPSPEARSPKPEALVSPPVVTPAYAVAEEPPVDEDDWEWTIAIARARAEAESVPPAPPIIAAPPVAATPRIAAPATPPAPAPAPVLPQRTGPVSTVIPVPELPRATGPLPVAAVRSRPAMATGPATTRRPAEPATPARPAPAASSGPLQAAHSLPSVLARPTGVRPADLAALPQTPRRMPRATGRVDDTIRTHAVPANSDSPGENTAVDIPPPPPAGAGGKRAAAKQR